MDEVMTLKRRRELLKMMATAMEEIRPLAHEDLVKFDVKSHECIDIHGITAAILKESELLRRRKSSENLVADYVIIERYIRKAVNFLKDAVEILKAYETGLPAITIPNPFLERICANVNDVDLYIGGVKSFIRLGVLRHVVEAE